jgi:hypothetical protein
LVRTIPADWSDLTVLSPVVSDAGGRFHWARPGRTVKLRSLTAAVAPGYPQDDESRLYMRTEVLAAAD